MNTKKAMTKTYDLSNDLFFGGIGDSGLRDPGTGTRLFYVGQDWRQSSENVRSIHQVRRAFHGQLLLPGDYTH